MADVHQRQLVTIAGDAPAPVDPGRRPADRGRRRRPGRARRRGGRRGAAATCTSRSPTPPPGEPVDDLQPFLAAAGHVVVMRADAQTFAHEHAEVEDANGRPVFALPGQTFGPELDVHAEFDTPGVYQLWGQFRLADGDVVTVPFTVEAS